MRQSLVPAWLVSLLLHVGVVLLLVYVNFGPKLPPPITGVPVTLVTSGPPASVQPEPTPAAQETAPPAPPEPTPAPPTPQPVPTPAKETPKPQPQAKPPAPAPTKAGKTKPTPPQKPQEQSQSNYDPLAAARKAFGSPASAAPRKLPPGPRAGPARVAPTAAQSGAALKGLVDKMDRLWTFDCSISGNRDTVIPIHFVLGPDGRFADGPTVQSGGSALFAGAAPSAVRALKAGQPYSTDEVPAEYRNQGITINFKTKDACAHR
ncbi:MAG TPA: hypothetical protein VGL66_04210 [Caulobacteraceae bacterium]|jgi:outer membrane biosynthesis protein TonB